MNNNEKFIGESLLLGTPKKKIRLKFRPGVIDTSLIREGSITKSKLSNEVINYLKNLVTDGTKDKADASMLESFAMKEELDAYITAEQIKHIYATKEELENLKVYSGKEEGFFSSEESLRSLRSNPAVGDWAIVKKDSKMLIAVCETAGVWTVTDDEYQHEAIDLSEYAKKSDLPTVPTTDKSLNKVSSNPIANAAVANALESKLDKTEAESKYATKEELEELELGSGNSGTDTPVNIDLSEYAKKTDIPSYTFKTVNGQSILGSGNILIEASTGDTFAKYVIDIDMMSGSASLTSDLRSVFGPAATFLTQFSDTSNKLLFFRVRTDKQKYVLIPALPINIGSANTIYGNNGSLEAVLTFDISGKNESSVEYTQVAERVTEIRQGNSGGSGETLDVNFESTLSDTVATTQAVGNLPMGTTVGSLKTKTLSQILEMMLFKEVWSGTKYSHETYIAGGVEKIVEVGDVINWPDVVLNWNSQITPADGVQAAIFTTDDGWQADFVEYGESSSVDKTTRLDWGSTIDTGDKTGVLELDVYYNYGEGYYEQTSNFGNTRKVEVPAHSDFVYQRIYVTLPWYIEDPDAEGVKIVAQPLMKPRSTIVVEKALTGRPRIYIPANAQIKIEADLGLGYMEVSGWTVINTTRYVGDKAIQKDYVMWAKNEKYIESVKHRITLTINN